MLILVLRYNKIHSNCWQMAKQTYICGGARDAQIKAMSLRDLACRSHGYSIGLLAMWFFKQNILLDCLLLVCFLFFRIFLSTCWITCRNFGPLDGSDRDQKKTEALLEISKFGTWKRISFQRVHIKTKEVNGRLLRNKTTGNQITDTKQIFFILFELPLIVDFYWSIFYGQLPLDTFSAMSILTLSYQVSNIF